MPLKLQHGRNLPCEFRPPPVPDRRGVVPAGATAMIRVMLVDDSDAFRSAAASFLATLSGVEIVGMVASGIEAIEQVGHLRPDLVLVDAVMPWMSGFDVTRRVKELSPATRVVMISLHDSEAYREAAVSAGADGFLGKNEFAPVLPGLLRELFA